MAPAGSGVLVGVAAAFVAAAAVALAGLVQGAVGSRAVVVAGDVLAACGRWSRWRAVAAGLGARLVACGALVELVVLAVALAAAGAALDSPARRDPGTVLRESGAVAAHAAGALASMDSRELGRALSDRLCPPGAAALAAPAVGRRAGPRAGWRRTCWCWSGRLGTWSSWSALPRCPSLVVSTPGLAGSVQIALAVLVGGYVAAIATGEGARRAEMVPTLDRLLPLSDREVRRARLVVPAVAMTLWSVVALGAVGLWRGDPWPWLGLGVLVGPAWAGAALRSAYRPAPELGQGAGVHTDGRAAHRCGRRPGARAGRRTGRAAADAGRRARRSVCRRRWSGSRSRTTLIALTWGSGLQQRSMMDRMLDASGQSQGGAQDSAQGRR